MQIFMSNVGSGSDRIRIHNTGIINIFILFFRYVRMHNCPFHSFPFPLLSTSSLFCHQKIDGASHPCSARFTVSYCNNFLIFSVFFMMCLFLSLLQGAVTFLFLDKRGVYIWEVGF
jgi:hypothetical protein